MPTPDERIELFKQELADLCEKHGVEISNGVDYSRRKDGSNCGMARHWTELTIDISAYDPIGYHLERQKFACRLTESTLRHAEKVDNVWYPGISKRK
jgi:hypothetical protein